MASSKWNKFGGIETFHEGMPVSDFRNVIPMGDSCIDRLGERMLWDGAGNDDYPRGVFADSLGNCYIVRGERVYRFMTDGEGRITEPAVMMARCGDEFTTLNPNDMCCFCESSTKPSQVYMCDGRYIYWWNTQDDGSGVAWTKPFVINMMVSPNVYPVVERFYQVGEKPDTYDFWQQFITQSDLYDQLKNGGDVFDVSEIASVSSITWFNNRLFATQPDKNTVWATCTDPAQFVRPGSGTITVDGITVNVFPRMMFRGNDSDTTDADNEVTVVSDLWVYWVSSTNGSDRLNQAIACNGQLYLMNAKSIEVWAASGDELAPITQSSLQTFGVGGRNGIVVMNRLVFIGENQVGSNFIGVIDGGSISYMSENELNHRIDFTRNPVLHVIRQRDDLFVGVNCYTKSMANSQWYMMDPVDYRWWRWEVSSRCTDWTIGTVLGEIGFTNKGHITEFTEDSRRQVDGCYIERSIRGCFSNFDGRKILRRVMSVMDTGKRLSGNDDRVYCRVSFDRAHSFGGFNYRKLGENNHNDKMIEWRNLGSGNSIVIEIGTGADYVFQLYELVVEIA